MEIKQNKYVDINPISKWKRIGVFLGDFFINFIVAFILFGAAITPLGKVMTSYENKANEFEICEKNRINILYDNELIFYEDEVYKYHEKIYLEYTYECFLSYYVLTGQVDFIPSSPKFGRYLSNEVIKHYYFDIYKNESKYYELFDKYNDKVGYFEKNLTNYILKEEYCSQLLDHFNPLGEMSEVGEEIFNNIASDVFFPLFAEILTNISDPSIDLSSPNYNLTYNQYSLRAENIRNYHTILLTICGFISFLLSTLLIYLIYPLIVKSRRTPTMSILKVDRINIDNFNHVGKLTYFVLFIYAIAFNLSFVMFLPMTLVSFAYTFQFSILVSFSFVSFVLLLISFIVLLFDPYSRCTSDKLSKTLLISEDDLIEIYKARGYMK